MKRSIYLLVARRNEVSSHTLKCLHSDDRRKFQWLTPPPPVKIFRPHYSNMTDFVARELKKSGKGMVWGRSNFLELTCSVGLARLISWNEIELLFYGVIIHIHLHCSYECAFDFQCLLSHDFVPFFVLNRNQEIHELSDITLVDGSASLGWLQRNVVRYHLQRIIRAN